MAANANPDLLVVVTGDEAVGKSCLIATLAESRFPDGGVPHVFNHWRVDQTIDFVVQDRKVALGVRESLHKDFVMDRLRPNPYLQADVVLCCFSVVSPSSFESVREHYFPTAMHFAPSVPIFVVATKIELRDDQGELDRLAKIDEKPVTFEEGVKMAEALGAAMYLECSARTSLGVRQIFEDAARIVLFPPVRRETPKYCLVC